jgi:hypothetical protein
MATLLLLLTLALSRPQPENARNKVSRLHQPVLNANRE